MFEWCGCVVKNGEAEAGSLLKPVDCYAEGPAEVGGGAPVF